MDNWMLPKLVDYWNDRADAIYRLSERLENLSPGDLEKNLKAIHQAIITHTRVLSDELLVTAGVLMAEDLYRSVEKISHWDPALPQYLEASAGTFCSVLSVRGYKIHYIINNSFEPTEIGMAGPLEWFPRWFSAAGFIYICSQFAAIELMKSDNQLAALHFELLPKYIEEARMVANGVVERCHQESNHYVFLDTDAEQDTFALVFAEVGSPGVITIARDHPPHIDRKCVVYPPPNLRELPYSKPIEP